MKLEREGRGSRVSKCWGGGGWLTSSSVLCRQDEGISGQTELAGKHHKADLPNHTVYMHL